jgi:hypothetical protein
MRFDKNQFLWNFIYICLAKGITFTDQDFYNFSKACNIKVDMKYAMENFFDNGVSKSAIGSKTTFVTTKSLLGPCYVHPEGISPKSVKYNISKIIQELKLDRQNISADEKLKKITDYIELLG